MRRLCHLEWNWQAKLTKCEPHSWDPRQRTTWSRRMTSDFNSVLGAHWWIHSQAKFRTECQNALNLSAVDMKLLLYFKEKGTYVLHIVNQKGVNSLHIEKQKGGNSYKHWEAERMLIVEHQKDHNSITTCRFDKLWGQIDQALCQMWWQVDWILGQWWPGIESDPKWTLSGSWFTCVF